MIQPETWIAIGRFADKAWSGFVALVGVLVGGYIANRSQRRHWILESKRVEYREVFSTLTKSYSYLVSTMSVGVLGGEEELKMEQAWMEGLNVLRDRVVIGQEVRSKELAERWSGAVGRYRQNQNYPEFALEFSRIMKILQENADKLIE